MKQYVEALTRGQGTEDHLSDDGVSPKIELIPMAGSIILTALWKYSNVIFAASPAPIRMIDGSIESSFPRMPVIFLAYGSETRERDVTRGPFFKIVNQKKVRVYIHQGKWSEHLNTN